MAMTRLSLSVQIFAGGRRLDQHPCSLSFDMQVKELDRTLHSG